ncbi:serine protease AprX [Pontibacter aydingkolensis]|uniref:S8 family peptidase n=1 Tax=Pontibacter aydingkolensis TaxID=1911536 RepID=A0ABS7CYK8_9BACT|nr:S8/S53 family peptidase [Pontibacter aydingkolensis]MBW7468948.1 S8 family peptidase [Pontibacter aydingkolensis]
MKQFLTLITVLCIFAGNALAQVTIDPELRQALQSAVEPVEVVVTFHGDNAPTASNIQLLNSLGITSGVTFQTLPIAGVLATALQVDVLAQNSQVRSLYLNKQLTYYNYHDTNLTGVQRLRLDMEMTTRNGGFPVSGKGIAVVINDSGIDGTHEDLKLGKNLKQNVLGTTNLRGFTTLSPPTWAENVPNTDTNSGHGTHCAGSVGGLGTMSNGKYAGVANGADLIGYGSGGALFILDAIGGYDYTILNQARYGIRVISNSWGTSGAFNPNNPVNVASLKAYKNNIISVFAAGNSGPGADTHNPYAVAPWVISVGAGDRFGRLAGFSSRGVKDHKETLSYDGRTWTVENRPTIVGPGVDVVSTRVLAPVSSLAAEKDAAVLSASELPYYTHMSGTSMATPHVAGIVALMLDANPALTAEQVKTILQKTATNMPGREPWEVGAGYVNAYAAIDHIFRNTSFGAQLNMSRNFNSNINSSVDAATYRIDYNPITASTNEKTFTVAQGITALEAKMNAYGLLGETGNPIGLSLIDPNGKEYRSGIYLAFTLYTDRVVAVANPIPGTWKVRIYGLNGVAVPETINVKVTQSKMLGSTGLSDIANHPAKSSIELAVSSRLADGLSDGTYKPDALLKRIELADYLMMGQGVRQFIPTTGATSFSDVATGQALLVESVTAKGAALRDRFHTLNGLMTASAGKFNPDGSVNRASLAYSLVQALGHQEEALKRNGQTPTVTVNGTKYEIEDAKNIPAGLEGFVSVALDLNLINAYYSLTQGPYDLQPTLHATFKPLTNVTRADFAVVATRTFDSWNAATPIFSVSSSSSMQVATETKSFSYPNPFNATTTITYSVANDGPVAIEVFDIMGKKIQTLVAETKKAGNHLVRFDGSSLPSGTYLYRISTGNQTYTSKMLIAR